MNSVTFQAQRQEERVSRIRGRLGHPSFPGEYIPLVV